jgi:hypothetical protein
VPAVAEHAPGALAASQVVAARALLADLLGGTAVSIDGVFLRARGEQGEGEHGGVEN